VPESSAGAKLSERINALLPQTQCTRCGYADCAAYSAAIASNEADINRCPPGGIEGIARLAALTGRAVVALDPNHGIEGPRSVAVIDEAWCIGCTLCLPACPTDAILGSNKRMHSVIEVHCTGCELCIPVCPVDCISLVNVSGDETGWQAWSAAQASAAAERYAQHQARLVNAEPLAASESPDAGKAGVDAPAVAADPKRAIIEAALARARGRAKSQA
jgi:electron transport complex protein RnfB